MLNSPIRPLLAWKTDSINTLIKGMNSILFFRSRSLDAWELEPLLLRIWQCMSGSKADDLFERQPFSCWGEAGWILVAGNELNRNWLGINLIVAE